jgi:hypothetical protein
MLVITLNEQSQIGWHSKCSRFGPRRRVGSTSATTILQLFSTDEKGRDGTFWSRSILTLNVTHWLERWEAQNKDVHGKDSDSKAISKKDQAIRKLEILYSYRDSVLHLDRHLFYDSVEDHRTKPTRFIRQWLNSCRDLLLQSIREAKSLSLRTYVYSSTLFWQGLTT